MKMREYPATVIRVIDGDTLEMVVDTGFRSTYLDKFRLIGLNAPEGKNTEAAARLSLLLYTGRQVVVSTTKPEKYGRWLCDIAVPEVCTSVCDLLLAEGLAVKYDGGAR